MKYNLIRLIIGLCISLFFITASPMAQDDSRTWSLVFTSADHILVYEPDVAEFRIIADRPHETLSLSPNSRYILYTQVFEFPDSDDYIGPKPTDIYVMDLATGETRLIAGQPEDATNQSQAIYRGNVVWSPDGNQIAWMEHFDRSDLNIANLATGETRVIAGDVPSQTLVSSVASITLWSQENGILIEHVLYDDNLENAKTGSFDFYQTDGSLNAVQNPFENYSSVRMLQTVDGERLAVNTSMGWFLMDPNSTNEPQPLNSGIFGRTKMFTAHSLVVTPPELHAIQPATYDIYSRGGTHLSSLGIGGAVTNLNIQMVSDSQTLVLDYDGMNLVLYDTQQGVYTMDVSADWQVMSPSGNTTVLIPDDDVFYTSRYCEDNSLSIRLNVNNTGYVLPDDANNVRSSPDLSAERIGSIPPLSLFDVLDGPVCADGYTWWQVDYLGTIGWTVEAGDGDYWLAPGCPPDGCGRG